MNNFISTFDELSKLYEEAPVEKKEDKKPEDAVEEACTKEALNEAAEDEEIEIVDDEMPEEEAPVEDEVADEPVEEEEPRQVILECSKCGALVIKPEADIVVDEESDLVNVEDTCEFCEESEGYTILGVVAPYATEDDVVTEGVGDWYRKKFDKPASITTQQMWEAELEDLQLALEGDIDDATRENYEKRIKELEQKFLQQRDWEERHKKNESVDEDADKEELEELLNFSVPVNVTANGNEVAVGGMT